MLTIIIMLINILGLTVYQTASTLFGQGSGPIFLANIRCSGSEMSLLDCPRTVFVGVECTHSRDVGVKCQRKPEHEIVMMIIYTTML